MRSASQKRPRKNPPNLIQRCFTSGFKVVLSPVVLVWDSLRAKGAADYSWVFSFSLLTTAIMMLAFGAVLITDNPVDRTLKLLTGIRGGREMLSGDINPVIHSINIYAVKNDIDPNLIFAIIEKESKFNPKAISVAGGRGLMQLTPAIWKQYSGSACTAHMNTRICKKNDCIYDPDANIRTGTRYLRALIDRYQGRVDLALEAYFLGISANASGLKPAARESKSFMMRVFAQWSELRKEAVLSRLDAALKYRAGVKWLLGAALLCWLIWFWWACRRLFRG
jgi:hypothetical protein